MPSSPSSIPPTTITPQENSIDPSAAPAAAAENESTKKSSKKRPPMPSLNEKIVVSRRSIYDLLKYMADDLKFYYSCIETRSTYGDRFIKSGDTIFRCVIIVQPIIEHVSNIAHEYDFDPQVPGNGYRSIISIIDACVLHLLSILREIHQQRTNILYRGNYYAKELESYVMAFVTLVKAVERVYEYLPVWPKNELFASDDVDEKLHGLMAEIESLDQSPFFGRMMGFQFCSSLLTTFQVIGISLASYSLLWDKDRPSSTSITGAASNLFTSGNYVINPEERGKRIYNVTVNADINFCKAFWNLTEAPLIHDFPKWFSPNMAVNEMWHIPGDLALNLETNDGRMIEVPPPTAHCGTKPLPMRFLSYQRREGMPIKGSIRVFKTGTTTVPTGLAKSPNLLMHVHGGGFVATSSKTHEPYLRHWAKSLNCPVVSVDYSLSPENPYPRATEEVFYAYAWILNNAEKLGWTGERICLVGDSAGGLLLASTTLRLIKRNIKRLPDGLVLIYPVFLAEYAPSPSRLLSLLDPLLPLGIVARCIAAYTGNVDVLKTDSPTTSTEGNPAPIIPPTPKVEPMKTLHNYVDTLYENRQLKESDKEGSNIAKQQTDSTDSQENVHFELVQNGDEEVDAEKEAQNLCKLIHRQLSRTSSDGARKRSQSEVCITNGSKSSAVEESSSDEDMDSSSFSADIISHVDPSSIIFTASVYDDSFLEYLGTHEATKTSFQRLNRESEKWKMNEEIPESTILHEKKSTDESNPDNQHGQKRSQSTGSIANLVGASASIGQQMGMYVMDSVSGWFTPSPSTDVWQIFDDNSKDSSDKKPIFSPLAKFHDMPAPKDPFLSPILAPDSWLAMFPRTAILACHLDPLLDDSVTFAKRLKRAGSNVSMDLVDALPHGFLNFATFSPECREAARISVQRMKEIFKLNQEQSQKKEK